ncbi:MAG: phosphate-starvation-inducible protein PsiE [Methylophagaceae bacterium]
MKNIRSLSGKILIAVQDLGLMLIAISAVIAVGFEFVTMYEARIVTLADLLLLFIYLEVLSMVSVYLSSGKLPVRIPLYIAIVALARYLILDMKNMEDWKMLGVAFAILLLTISVLSLRFGHTQYPYDKDTDAS